MISSAPGIDNNIIKLSNEYPIGNVMYGYRAFSIITAVPIVNRGFMGSNGILALSSQKFIAHEASACIAAPIINMVAINKISLGMTEQGAENFFPVRLYASQQLSITTQHLSIGRNFKMICEPGYGFISCKELTLSKFTEEEPPYFEIVTSWLMNDDTEVILC